MGALDRQIEETLDELVPPRAAPGRWDEIAAHAPRNPLRRRRLVRVVPVLAAAVAVAALVLAWPFGGAPHSTILERAAAAIGDGPVMHALLRDGSTNTLIDLDTGARTPMYLEIEIWFDHERGYHAVARLGEEVVAEERTLAGTDPKADRAFTDLAGGFRDALRDGRARVLGPAVLNGKPVYWIRVDTQAQSDADGKHVDAFDVAVSQDSYTPVATRATRDGKLIPGKQSTILRIESLPAGSGDFTGTVGANPMDITIRGVSSGSGSLAPAEVTRALGRPALWAGPSVAGLALATIEPEAYETDPDPKTGEPHRYKGVTLIYGTTEPFGSKPFVRIAESPGFENDGWFSPPDGSLLVFENTGTMQQDGLQLELQASSEELLLAAARALRSVPAS